MPAPKVLIIAGNGFNCEQETSYAFSSCGGDTAIVHMNDLLSKEVRLSNFQILVFVGGFSYGDHLGSGRITANKFRFYLSDEIIEFIGRNTLIIGICNGFQVITQLGLLPGIGNEKMKHTISLAPNASARYEDRWVDLAVNSDSPCVFTKGISRLFLPVRHGEGKVFSPDAEVVDQMFRLNRVVLKYIDPATGTPTQTYPHNPNGSLHAIAGLCNETGRVFGLMPHPEACLSPYNYPHWTRLLTDANFPNEGEGIKIFRNAVHYFQ